MRDTLPQLALGIQSPWFVAATDFNLDNKRLDIALDLKSGSRLRGVQGRRLPGCATRSRSRGDIWISFSIRRFSPRTPRITCAKCGVRLVTVPWARPGSGFMLLFEGFAMALAMHLPIAVAAGVCAAWLIRPHACNNI
jgi:transposase